MPGVMRQGSDANGHALVGADGETTCVGMVLTECVSSFDGPFLTKPETGLRFRRPFG